MYIFVRVQERESYYTTGPDASAARVKARLEQASGERCLIVPYQEFHMQMLEELDPRAILMSGFGGRFEDRKVKDFWGMDEVLHHADLPILCFCGSHQVLGFSFNQNLREVESLRDEPMRKLDPEEDLPRRAAGDPDLSSFFIADGFYPIRQVREDPLFRGLPETMIMRCSHYCEVKNLPKEFELLATSKYCRIEAMRHRNRPLYGTQFHPEAYEAPFFHGRTLLENFAQIVRDFWTVKGDPK